MSSDLSTRRLMIVAALKILRDDDMAQDDAIKHYEAQLAEIDEKIRKENAAALRNMNELRNAINKNQVTVINLKPGIIQVNPKKEQNG